MQAFRSQLPQDAAEYVRLNVLPRPGVGAAPPQTAGLAVEHPAGGAAYGLARGTGWVLENTLFRPQQGSEDAAVQDVRSANGMNDATQPQHFWNAALRQQHFRQPRKQPRLLAVRLPRRRSPTTRRAPSPGA